MDIGTESLLVAHAERSRTRAKRTVAEQVAMLTDALAAFEEGHMDVVKEFMERARDALDQEVAALTVDGVITRERKW